MIPKLVISWLFVLQFLILQAQDAKEVYGSFTAGCKVFNYHLKESSNHIYGFSVYEIGKELQILNLEPKKYTATDSLVSFLAKKIDSVAAASETPESEKLRLKNAKPLVKKLLGLLQEAFPKVSTLKAFADEEKRSAIADLVTQNNAVNVDSAIIFLNANKAPGEEYYSFTELLEALSKMVDVLKGNSTPEYMSFHEMKLDVFENIFNDQLSKVIKIYPSACPPDRNLGSKIFYEIKARLDFFDNEPVTAYLKLRSKRIRVFISNNKTDPKNSKNNNDKTAKDQSPDGKSKLVVADPSGKTNDWENAGNAGSSFLRKNKDYLDFTVQNVQAEFEEGTLKNLFVDLLHTPDNKDPISVRFRNNIPISVSAKFSPDAFDEQKIYAGIPCQLYRALYNRGISTAQNLQRDKNANSQSGCRELYFLLSDLLEYQVVAENDKEDYSPANRVYNLNEQNPIQQLKKEKKSRLFVLKAFSDFVGVQDDQPNGLIQFEASKKINLKTTPVQSSRSVYWGAFTYVEPKIVFSKIEKNNRYLYLDGLFLDSAAAKSRNEKTFFVNPLQLIRYANFNFQTDLNLLRMNIPQGKSNLQGNARVGYYRTAVSDSVNVVNSTIQESIDLKTDNINTGYVGISLLWEMKPDSRFGLSFNYDIVLLKAFSTGYRVKGTFRDKLVQSFGFDGYLKTNEEGGRVFFRTRMNNLFANAKQNFIQIQLGYAANIFKAN